LRSPGTLDPDEMDPFWAEGDVSAVDQLNRLIARLRGSLTSGAGVPAAGPSQAPDGELETEGMSPGARRLRASAGG
jgi:hypothetical protein